MQALRPDSREFWRDKRVLVTGGNGFLGKVVVRKLRERGAAAVLVAVMKATQPGLQPR